MAKVIGVTGEILTDDSRQLSLLADSNLPERLRKAVEVVHMYPVSGQYSHFCRRVFNALLLVTTKGWQSIPSELQAKVLDERRVLRFAATVGELGKVLRATTRATERIYDAVENLYGQEFRFDAMGERGDMYKVASRLISQYSRSSDGSGEVQWEFPPDVFEMLMSPGRWAAIDIHLANRFNSGHSLALYENTHRYIRVQLTARMPVVDWVKLLVSPDAAETFLQQGNYRYFKRDILLPAMRELESTEACPFSVELLETTGSRNKVTHLQFRLHLKVQAALDMDTSQTGDPRLEAKLREYGITERGIDQLLTKYDEPVLRLHIAAFDKRLAEGGIRDKAAAFVHQVKNDYYGRSPQQEGQADAPALPAPAVDTRKQDEADFAKHIAQRVRKYYLGQPRFVQDQLLQAFLNSPDTPNLVREQFAKKGFKTPAVSGTFYAWMAKQEGVLSLPEDASLDAYLDWRNEPKSSKGPRVLSTKLSVGGPTSSGRRKKAASPREVPAD
ncbi:MULTISPECIES: replication initiation protein [unclassified Variovorax]|uniref:replication initiation protein n=1 Tax=unclassified Variovorax TaxID=663243 RepID=UPI0008384778|nr:MULTISPECIES: replication initiation protein [unclassified Variovorax]VTV17934.1 hypothetical protein WDL1P1_00776 [Variovorax sp. WDL1]